MRYFREIYSRTISFIKKHDLIDNEEGIMVGVSGGKDSLTLLTVLHAFQRSSRFKYSLAGGYVDLGLGAEYAEVEAFCGEMGIPFFVEKTDIAPVVFDIRKEKNPCSLCAKMRRGALNDLAKRNGYDKVALGHNREDFVETFLLNLFYAGKADTFKPKTYLDKKDVTVIRPMLAVPEELIRRHAQNVALPLLKSSCTADGNTAREDMRKLLNDLELMNENSVELAFRALDRMISMPGEGKE